MTDGNVPDSERCIAITGGGNRCKRIAKDGQFCFQHDASDETVAVAQSEKPGIVNWLSSELESRAASTSGIQRDVYMNLADLQDGVRSLVNDFKSGDVSLSTLVARFDDIATETGGERSKKTGAGGIVGGIFGAILGPGGSLAGMIAGSTVAFYLTKKDPRAIVGFAIEDVPEGAEVISSHHEAIKDVNPIQIVIAGATEDEQEDWVRETNTRAWDMNAVEKALAELPKHEAEESPPGGYYVNEVESDTTVVLVFGEPDDTFPEM